MTWGYSVVFNQSKQNLSLHFINWFKEKEMHRIFFEAASKLLFGLSKSAKNPCQQFREWILPACHLVFRTSIASGRAGASLRMTKSGFWESLC